ncbi:MAG TPA: hypothetical protein VH395_18390, partial [Jatrophihabitantaceae bacterium]
QAYSLRVASLLDMIPLESCVLGALGVQPSGGMEIAGTLGDPRLDGLACPGHDRRTDLIHRE